MHEWIHDIYFTHDIKFFFLSNIYFPCRLRPNQKTYLRTEYSTEWIEWSGWKTNRCKKRTWHGKEIDRWRENGEIIMSENCVDALNRDNTHFQSKLCENDAKSMAIHYWAQYFLSFFSHSWFAFLCFFPVNKTYKFSFILTLLALYHSIYRRFRTI